MTRKVHEGNKKIFSFSGIRHDFGHPNASARNAAYEVQPKEKQQG